MPSIPAYCNIHPTMPQSLTNAYHTTDPSYPATHTHSRPNPMHSATFHTLHSLNSATCIPLCHPLNAATRIPLCPQPPEQEYHYAPNPMNTATRIPLCPQSQENCIMHPTIHSIHWTSSPLCHHLNTATCTLCLILSEHTSNHVSCCVHTSHHAPYSLNIHPTYSLNIQPTMPHTLWTYIPPCLIPSERTPMPHTLKTYIPQCLWTYIPPCLIRSEHTSHHGSYSEHTSHHASLNIHPHNASEHTSHHASYSLYIHPNMPHALCTYIPPCLILSEHTSHHASYSLWTYIPPCLILSEHTSHHASYIPPCLILSEHTSHHAPYSLNIHPTMPHTLWTYIPPCLILSEHTSHHASYSEHTTMPHTTWTNMPHALCTYIPPCLTLNIHPTMPHTLNIHTTMPHTLWINIPSCPSTCYIHPLQLRQPRRLCCHQVHCMYWGHLGHFYGAIYHLKWYKTVCMTYLACTFSQIKSINMFSIYLQYGVPRHFLWRFIAVWT